MLAQLGLDVFPPALLRQFSSLSFAYRLACLVMLTPGPPPPTPLLQNTFGPALPAVGTLSVAPITSFKAGFERYDNPCLVVVPGFIVYSGLDSSTLTVRMDTEPYSTVGPVYTTTSFLAAYAGGAHFMARVPRCVHHEPAGIA
jgi:hypothetical protein